MLHYIVILISFITLLVFWGCVKTYTIKGRILVDGMGFRSVEFYWWVILVVFLAIFLGIREVGKWALLIFYSLWFIALFMNHWKLYLFGASEKKVKGYNDCFENTIKLFRHSEKRIIPDLYHILLTLVVAFDLLFVLALCKAS